MINKEKLRIAIRKTGLRNYEFAEEAGMSTNSLTQILHNSCSPNFSSVEKIAAVLDQYEVVTYENFFKELTK